MGAQDKYTTVRGLWMVTREYDGLAGAGGVKDVSKQLAEALVRSGRSVRVVLPRYGFMDVERLGFKPEGLSFSVDMPYVGVERRETVEIWSLTLNGVGLYLIDAPRYREKMGVYTYTADEAVQQPQFRQGNGHFDYFAMNVLLQKAALDLIILKGDRPDVIHCQDGHTALIPAMMREIEGFRHYFRNTGAIVTIHNAGTGYHQEVADLAFARTICGLPWTVIDKNLLDGAFDPFLAASSYAIMNTVSENYARELQETDLDAGTGLLGHGLRDRGVVLEGVTNGINPADFDPTNPEKHGLAAAFDPATGDLAGKRACRAALVTALAEKKVPGLSVVGTLELRPEEPLFTFIGRLTPQKGVDKLIDALQALLPLDHGFQVIVLGTGPKAIEEMLVELASEPHHAGRVCVVRGYSQEMADKIYAAGDFFVIPSEYEPCGLTDYMAQLFGNIPIVRHVGGLVKVKDGVTGFAYKEHNYSALAWAMQRAIHTFRTAPKTILTMQKTAVEHIRRYYTWDQVVGRYLKLYRATLKDLGKDA